MTLQDLLGLVGGALLLFGYWRKDALAPVPGGLINFFGAGLVGYNAWVQRAWGPFWLEFAWMGIALWTVIKALRKP
jgi:hypothetical protein